MRDRLLSQMSGQRPKFPVRPLLVSLTLHAPLLFMPAVEVTTGSGPPRARISIVQLRVSVVKNDSRPAETVTRKLSTEPLPKRAASRRQRLVHERQVGSASINAEPADRSAAPIEFGGFAPGAPSPARDSAAAEDSEQAAAAAASERDVDDEREYRIALAVAARRFRQYPALAREHALEGSVGVDLVLQPHGRPMILLARSSGHEVLDEAALSMMRRAAELALIPDGLRRRNARLQLPVFFSLADETPVSEP